MTMRRSTLLSMHTRLLLPLFVGLLLFAVLIHVSAASSLSDSSSSNSFLQWSRGLHDVLNGVAKLNGVGDNSAFDNDQTVNDEHDDAQESNIQRAMRALADPVRFIYQRANTRTRQIQVAPTRNVMDDEDSNSDTRAADPETVSDMSTRDDTPLTQSAMSSSSSDVFVTFDFASQNVSNWLYGFNISMTCLGCTRNLWVTVNLRVTSGNLSPNEYEIDRPNFSDHEYFEFTPANTTNASLAVSHRNLPVTLKAVHRTDTRFFNLSIVNVHVNNYTDGHWDPNEMNYTLGNASTIIYVVYDRCGLGFPTQFTRPNGSDIETRYVCLCPFDWTGAGCQTPRPATCHTDVIEPANQCADNKTAAAAAARGIAAGYQRALNGDPTCSLLSDTKTNNVSLSVRCAFDDPLYPDAYASYFFYFGYAPENTSIIPSLVVDGFTRTQMDFLPANYTFIEQDATDRIVFAMTGEPPMYVESQIHNLKRLSDTNYYYNALLLPHQLSSLNNIKRIPMHEFKLNDLDRKQYRAGGRVIISTRLSVGPPGTRSEATTFIADDPTFVIPPYSRTQQLSQVFVTLIVIFVVIVVLLIGRYLYKKWTEYRHRQHIHKLSVEAAQVLSPTIEPNEE